MGYRVLRLGVNSCASEAVFRERSNRQAMVGTAIKMAGRATGERR